MTSTKTTINDFKNVLKSLTNKYEHEIQELITLEDNTGIPDLVELRSAKVRTIMLDLAQDYTLLIRYRLDNPGDYYSKQVEPVVAYLRDVRQSVSIYLTTLR